MLCSTSPQSLPAVVQERATRSNRVYHRQESASDGPREVFAGIPNNQLRLDTHALAGLYSCKLRTFDGYIQSLNPNLT